MKKIALFIAAVISAPALAWTNGDISKNVDFAGTITPEQYSQLWRWKVGTGLNGFQHNLTDMEQELKKLTIRADSPKGLLYGETVKAMRANVGLGAIPNIALSDYENNAVNLVQGSSDGEGKGYITLPIKDEQNNKIGSLKVNVTAVGLAVGAERDTPSKSLGMSVHATSENHALYGGLFSKSIANGYSTANQTVIKFGGKNASQLNQDVRQHPLLQGISANGWLNRPWSAPVNFQESDGVKFGVHALSYVLGVDTGQTLEATFDSPVTATTKWSAPLNVAVTYR